ncbi:MAG: PepSY domain-containing protein [Rubripirellula sp.]
MMIARRVHLYAGLFLLPWVFLYGITGAMFNHQGLLSDVESISIPESAVQGSVMSEFPTPDELARRVVLAINKASDEFEMESIGDSGAKFTNNLMFEVRVDGRKHILHINPNNHDSYLLKLPIDDFKPTKLVTSIKNIQLDENPQQIAERSAESILADSGIEFAGSLHAHGYTKLNFLASVDGEPARVTYVVRDGHIDVTKYDGRPGTSLRGFFLRLHTSHGQTPSWTARMVWSLFVDTMAFAMVGWGLTGLLMWWQIKRVRVIGGIVMVSSILVAVAMYFAMQNFYATNML